MGCINVREGQGVVRVYKLDPCGGVYGSSNNLLSTDQISEITWEDTLDEGDQITERNFGGKKCYSASGADEITHIAVSLTTCGVIPALDTLLMDSDPIIDETEYTGFGRTDLNSAAGVAVEVLLELDQGQCSGGNVAPVFGLLFPLVRNWRPSGGSTLNGEQLLKPQYSGKAYKNTTLVGELPAELSHWESITAAGHWYTLNVFTDGEVAVPDVDDPGEVSCDLLSYSGS